MFEVIDRTFPNKQMTIDDAFLITVVPQINMSGFNIANPAIDSIKYNHEELRAQLNGQPVLGSSFSLSKAVPDASKSITTGSFVKSIPNHGPRDSDGGATSSHSSTNSPNSLVEMRGSIDSPRDSSTSPTTGPNSFLFPSTTTSNNAQNSYAIPSVNLNSSAQNPTNHSNLAAGPVINHNNNVEDKNNASAAQNKRNPNSRDKAGAGNGVILLPRQFKPQSTSTVARKAGQSRLSTYTNSGGHSQSAMPASSASESLRLAISPPSSVTSHPRTHSLPTLRDDRTRSSTFQRKKTNTPPTILQVDGVLEVSMQHKKKDGLNAAAAAASSAVAIHADGDSHISVRQKIRNDDTTKEKRFSSSSKADGRNSHTSSSVSLAKLNMQSSSARSSREANNQPTTVQKHNAMSSSNDDHSNSINNNRKLLLSINKGISPYTTVVPQINVLIVEDNVINQKILEKFLRKRKIRSATAKNGKEAIEKWQKGGFHLVLMDIQLPVMSGIEATKKIRKLEHQNRIGVFSNAKAPSSEQEGDAVVAEPIKPEDRLDTKMFRSPIIIVALTASSSLADKSDALAAGCNDFLTKPVNLKWLEQKTIEWGCMQALIDFEGWKHWVSKEPISNPVSPGIGKISTPPLNAQGSRKKTISSGSKPTLERGHSSPIMRRPYQKDSSSVSAVGRKSPGIISLGAPMALTSSTIPLHMTSLTPSSPITGVPNTQNATGLLKSPLSSGAESHYFGSHVLESTKLSSLSAAVPFLTRAKSLSRTSSRSSKSSSIPSSLS